MLITSRMHANVYLLKMVVDTTDALKSYHEAAKRQGLARSIDHTVLIIDKSVHMFPWESLPCLEGHPVSRLPSLASLRERLLMQNFRLTASPPGLYIDQQKG